MGTNTKIELKAEERTFNVGIPYNRPDTRVYQKNSFCQFPVILNTATTGHKLQGQTVESLLINNWYYGNNWQYVIVLSRTTTLQGLFLRQELDSSKEYSVDPKLLFHLAKLRGSISIA